MAVVLYHKDGKQIIVEPDIFHSYLSSGEWFLTVEEAAKKPAKKAEKPEESDEDKEVRAKAKKLKIKNWHNKKIDKLRKEVDEWQPKT